MSGSDLGGVTPRAESRTFGTRPASTRPAYIEVDLDAIRSNVRVLAELAAPAAVCAVVKANGYSHGAVRVAAAALEGGAKWLAVAVVEEGLELRDSGIDAPILVLTQPGYSAASTAVAARLTPTVDTAAGIARFAELAAASGRPLAVHLKVNTGMNRVGAAPRDTVGLARTIVDDPFLDLGGVYTHLAVADEPDRPETGDQLDRYDDVLGRLGAAGIDPGLRHAANSAGAIAHPRSRLDLVRCGIAVYGLAPSPELRAGGFNGCAELTPALEVRAAVSFVKQIEAGEGVSYGLRYVADRPTTVATVPLGYADGIDRRLGLTGGEVLLGGRRRRIAGTVTMDQLMIDCGDDVVAVGDEVVLIGRQGDEVVTATEWAERLGTIAYEVICRFGPRLPRRYVGG